MAKKTNLAATLYWHCKTPEGWRRFRVEPGKNGRLRKGWVTDNGIECHYPEGSYHLRTYKDGRTIFQPLTDDKAAALSTRRSTTGVLLAEKHSRGTGATIVRPEAGDKNLEQWRDTFLEHIGLRIRPQSLASYERTIAIFLDTVRKTHPNEIVADDFFLTVKKFEKQRKSESTIFSYAYRLLRYLKFAGVPKDRLPESADMPREPKLEVETYDEPDLLTLIAGAKTLRNALLYEFLWKTGAREREATYLQWTDIDFNRGIVRFRNKPAIGFRIKTAEERDLPLSPRLLASLTDYHAKYPHHRFIFGTGRDAQPRKNSLRYLKRDVWRLGLACKMCEGCKIYNECEQWKLHKFRSTFATTYLHNGGDLRTLMSLMGHQDMQSTLRYLKKTTTAETMAQIARIFDGTPKNNIITIAKRRRA